MTKIQTWLIAISTAICFFAGFVAVSGGMLAFMYVLCMFLPSLEIACLVGMLIAWSVIMGVGHVQHLENNRYLKSGDPLRSIGLRRKKH